MNGLTLGSDQSWWLKPVRLNASSLVARLNTPCVISLSARPAGCWLFPTLGR